MNMYNQWAYNILYYTGWACHRCGFRLVRIPACPQSQESRKSLVPVFYIVKWWNWLDAIVKMSIDTSYVC